MLQLPTMPKPYYFLLFQNQASHQHFKPFLKIGNESYLSENQKFKLVYYCILIYVVWT